MAAEEATRLRLFVAIEPPADWRAALTRLQQAQERQAPGHFRWVRPEHLHLTLVFLGYHSAVSLERIVGAVQASAHGVRPFHLSPGETGVFGPRHAPRVLWVGVEDSELTLGRLRQGLERELRLAEISFDDKPLRPHLTLGRARGRVPGPVRVLHQQLHVPPTRVERLVLVESQLGPTGPTHFVRSAPVLNG